MEMNPIILSVSDKLIGVMLKQQAHRSLEGHIAGKHPVSFAALNLILVTKVSADTHARTHTHTHEMNTDPRSIDLPISTRLIYVF